MKIKVGVVQDAPVFFDKERTLDKLEEIVIRHADDGCKLLVFPESYIPGYPRGFSFGATVGSRTDEGRSLYQAYHQASVDLQSDDRQRLESIAAESDIYLCFYISPTDGIMGIHRKIKPTGTERLIWAESDGQDLVVCDTKIGKIGGLICWENYMPMARQAMLQQGVELYIAPTADARPQWTSSMIHIALEGRCFVLAANQYVTKSMYPDRFQQHLKAEPEVMCRGGSIIVSPLGQVIAGPLYDENGVLTTEIDLDEIVKSKLDFDNNGHYTRPDIFQLEVKNMPDIIKESK